MNRSAPTSEPLSEQASQRINLGGLFDQPRDIGRCMFLAVAFGQIQEFFLVTGTAGTEQLIGLQDLVLRYIRELGAPIEVVGKTRPTDGSGHLALKLESPRRDPDVPRR